MSFLPVNNTRGSNSLLSNLLDQLESAVSRVDVDGESAVVQIPNAAGVLEKAVNTTEMAKYGVLYTEQGRMHTFTLNSPDFSKIYAGQRARVHTAATNCFEAAKSTLKGFEANKKSKINVSNDAIRTIKTEMAYYKTIMDGTQAPWYKRPLPYITAAVSIAVAVGSYFLLNNTEQASAI